MPLYRQQALFMSQCAFMKARLLCSRLTRPVIASLDHPLSASRKEGVFLKKISSYSPSLLVERGLGVSPAGASYFFSTNPI